MIDRLRRLVEEMREEARAHGWLPALGSSARRLFERLVRRELDEVLIACDLTRPLDFSGPAALELEEIGPGHLPVLEEFGRRHTSAADVSKLRAYLRNGYRGQIARENGEMIGYIWSVDCRVPPERTHPALRRLGFELGEKDVYSWDLLLAPSHRGGGRARTFYGRHLQTLKDEGYRRVLGWVEASNTPARMLYSRLGWDDVGRRTSRLWFSTFLISNGRIFLRNGGRSATPYDYRPLLSRKAA
jgi:GNAT superfamily N-acetyltransferase